MSVKYIPPSKNVGESVHDINDNFETLDKQNTAIAQSVAGKADTADVQNLAEQLNNKANTSDLDSKADKNSLASKVDNDQTGATELLNTFMESESTPQNEDSIILKHLNQYVRTPFTSLWNWIKSNLAKVATSGSYNDLSDKPTIPTVDTSFDSKKANPVAGNTILAALNSKANTSDIQVLETKINAKVDAAELAKVATSGSYSDLKDKPGVTANVTSGDGSLITSGGVYSKLYQYRPMVVLPGTSGSTGYVCFAELKVTGNYVNTPIEFKISSRGRFICNVVVRFANKGNTDPDIETLSFCGQDYKIYAYKSATSTWGLYALKSENYDSINVLATYRPGQFNGTITYPGTFVAAKHTGTTTNPVVDSTWGYKVGTAINANTWDGHTTAQTVLFTAESDVKSATIDGLFTKYTLIWAQFVGSKTTHTHIIPLAYLKSKGSLVFKDSGVPFNILYVSDTQIRWFDVQASGAESYTSVTIVKII